MNKLLSYFVMGSLAASLGLFACTVNSTSGDDDEEETDGGGSSSSSGGKNSSSGGNGSSSGGGNGSSSGGGQQSDVEVTAASIDPDTATVDTEAEHDWEFTFTGEPVSGDDGPEVAVVLMDFPEEFDPDTQFAGLYAGVGNPSVDGTTVSGKIKFKAPVAGEYTLGLGFNNDPGNQQSQDFAVKTVKITASAD